MLVKSTGVQAGCGKANAMRIMAKAVLIETRELAGQVMWILLSVTSGG